MRVRLAAGEVDRLRGAKRLAEPVPEVAAVRERAALDEPLGVEPVQEEPGARLRRARVDRADRGRGADHQRRPPRLDAVRADVRAGAVAERREPRLVAVNRLVRERRQALRPDADGVEQLPVPVAGGEVEQPGAGSARRASRRARRAGAAAGTRRSRGSVRRGRTPPAAPRAARAAWRARSSGAGTRPSAGAPLPGRVAAPARPPARPSACPARSGAARPAARAQSTGSRLCQKQLTPTASTGSRPRTCS